MCLRFIRRFDRQRRNRLYSEIRRVLRPGGRIVLVNMSKPGAAASLFERCYRALPLFGGWLFVSRPVLAAPLLEAAGFAAVAREYHPSFPVGSEIAWGLSPARTRPD